MRVRAADDAETVSRRIAELRQERSDNLNCRCHRADDGSAILSNECPVHKAGVAPAGPNDLLSGLPDDDWERLREECGWCIAAQGR